MRKYALWVRPVRPGDPGYDDGIRYKIVRVVSPYTGYRVGNVFRRGQIVANKYGAQVYPKEWGWRVRILK